MSIETAAGGVVIKIFGVPVLAGAAATALLFLFMWPKTLKEAFVRFACSVLSSFTLGPILALAAWVKWPALYRGAMQAAAAAGLDPLAGVLTIGAPFLFVAALPAWYILGGIVLWFERRRGKDIGEMAHDAIETAKEVRGVIQ